MFKSRSLELEYIDVTGCDNAIIRKSHYFMQLVNRYFGGISAVKSFLCDAAAETSQTAVLNVLDIGSGTCDIPLEIARWAAQHEIPIRVTCVEKNGWACSVAGEAVRSSELKNIRVVCADVFEYEPDEVFDYAIGSMFFHHFTQEQIIILIDRLRRFVKRDILINDLHRSFFVYYSCCLLWPILGKDVLHDALLSIKKGFRKDELKAMLKEIEHKRLDVQRRFFGRITARIGFDKGK